MKKFFKGLLITIGIIVSLFILFVVIVIVDDVKNEKKLDEIVTEMFESGEVDLNIKLSSDYGTVEKMIKDDYYSFKNIADKLITEYENPVIKRCLSAKNIKDDGPDFIDTKKELNEMKKKNSELILEMKELIKDENIRAKVKENDLPDYAFDMYEKYINGIKNEIDVIEKENKRFDDVIVSVFEVLDFLTINKDKWYSDGEYVYFESDALIEKYKWLLSKICPDCYDENVSV